MNKLLRIVFLFFVLPLGVWAGIGNDGKKEKEPSSLANTSTTSMRGTRIAAEAVLKKEAIEALNMQLSGIKLSQSITFKPSTTFLAEKKVSALVEDERTKAITFFDKLEHSTGIIDADKAIVPPLNPIALPVGISKHVSANSKVIIGFSEIKMYPTYAELTAFVKMEMLVDDGQTGTKKQKDLFFLPLLV